MYFPSDTLRQKVESLPNLPGVYQFFDASGVVIYVGKAKSLRKRVTSYFNEARQQENGKLQVLVSKIADVLFTVVASEAEAFLLENTYIKRLQPRYNINLKDDKTYPSICVKKELFPRVFLTRKIIKDGSKYYGPYSSVRTARFLLEFIRNLYPLRTCSLKLNLEDIAIGRFKSCLELQMGNCKGPCVGLQSLDSYNEGIQLIASILKGDLSFVKESVKANMLQASNSLQFELANEFKDKLQLLADFQAKSTVVNSSVGNVDVFCIIKEGALAYSSFMRVANGSLIYSYTMELTSPLDESLPELLCFAILEIKDMVGVLNKEIIVPFEPEAKFDDVTFFIPQRGDRQKLLTMAENNCRAYITQRIEQLEQVDPESVLQQRLKIIMRDLHASALPYHIECFDNSNTQGTNPVAACVVFKNAKPSKKNYRHFLIKSVDSPNDFASMEEVIYRRYKRLLDEGGELPQLIVVDGGKGQLSAAVNSLKKLELTEKISIIGLAKRLEEVFLPNDSTPLYLNKNSFTLKVLMRIRDEAHRFGIKFHRKRRLNKMLGHELEQISGIGEASVNKLLAHYKTIAQIKAAGYDNIALQVGVRQAKALKEAEFFA
jgi:excinuclease ABC subunit C